MHDTHNAAPFRLLSVVIPARDEESCIASTVEHLHIELRLHKVPHQIVVVDDGYVWLEKYYSRGDYKREAREISNSLEAEGQLGSADKSLPP